MRREPVPLLRWGLMDRKRSLRGRIDLEKKRRFEKSLDMKERIYYLYIRIFE
jgi:hypothetical protein